MNSCILWTKAKNSAGYGITWFNNKWAYAHRVAINAQDGDVVRHTCDNPSCVNPDHLVIGTHKENSADMIARNRHPWGERSGKNKLTNEQVLEIRSSPLSSRTLAKHYGISKTNVLDIKRRKTWRYL